MFTIKQIFEESISVLIIASVLSLITGLLLSSIQKTLLIVPALIIILPALNGTVGNFGVIITSRITTALYEKKVKGLWYHTKIAKHLFKDLIPISVFSAFYIAVLSTVIANINGYGFDIITLLKIMIITLITTISLVLLIFIVAICGSIYIYNKKADPDDVLIPITTSIADLGSVIIFSSLVFLLF